MRASELCALNWEDVDLARGFINNIRDVKLSHRVAHGRQRHVPLHREAQKALEGMPSARNGPVIRDSHGVTVVPSRIRMALNLVVKEHLATSQEEEETVFAVRHIRPHSLRQFFAWNCARSGIPMPMVRQWLGLSSALWADRQTWSFAPSPDQERKLMDQVKAVSELDGGVGSHDGEVRSF